jgi:predicted ATP-binding protein involved in virulence
MRLRELSLTNFRCFEQLGIVFPADLVVFVGNNGAGKTAILDAIGYVLSRILTRLPGIEGRNLRREDIRMEPRGVQAPFVRVEAQDTEGTRWARTLRRDPTKQTAAEVPDGIGDRGLFEVLDPTIHAIEEGESVTMPVFAYYGVSRAVFEIPERRRDFRKEFRRFDALENALEPTTRFKDLIEWFYAQERDEMERRTQVLATPEVQAWINSSNAVPPPVTMEALKQAGPLPVLQAVRAALAQIIPGLTHPRIKTNPLRMVLTQHLDDGSERELSLQMLSDGYRTMLALVMDFARRMAQANPHLEKPLEAEGILIVDEIDLHLHPVWQQTVIPSFRRAFPNTQLILSTHSPQVLTTVEAGNILIVEAGGVNPSPAPTYGARSSDVVAEVLGLKSLRPPDNEIARKISALFQALDAGNLGDAKRCRVELESWAKGFPEPDLVRADLLIRRLEHQRQEPAAAV